MAAVSTDVTSPRPTLLKKEATQVQLLESNLQKQKAELSESHALGESQRQDLEVRPRSVAPIQCMFAL